MAIDTAAKRASALGFVVFGLTVIPDGTIGQADRQTLLNCYGGILSGEAIDDEVLRGGDSSKRRKNMIDSSMDALLTREDEEAIAAFMTIRRKH